jgi:cobyrinic acid a,c-diamide synthase
MRGVVLNRVAGERHEKILREVIADSCGLPVLGAIPRQSEDPFPERHLGLVPPQEHGKVPSAVEAVAGIVSRHLDLEALREIASAAPGLPAEWDTPSVSETESEAGSAVIGVFRDEAFQFYYPENLEALERAGGRIVECSPLRDERLPPVDAIYIGGGFPEMFAAQLAANDSFRREVAEAVERGMPVYAECAGAVYLGDGLVVGENTYPMVGALPVLFGFGPKPQGHGYAVVEVAGRNPFHKPGAILRGHEFHYTHVLQLDETEVSLAFRIKRGYGIDGERDGICRKNALASYCHIHALGVEGWAKSLVGAGVSTRSR